MQAEEEAYDSEFEEAAEEHKGWNKGIILVALLGILSTASSFYYMSKYPNTTKAATPTIVPKVPLRKKK